MAIESPEKEIDMSDILENTTTIMKDDHPTTDEITEEDLKREREMKFIDYINKKGKFIKAEQNQLKFHLKSN